MSDASPTSPAAGGVSPLAPAVSPLGEADPNSVNRLIAERIDEIFNKDPTKKDENGNYLLTDADLNVMIEYYRRERQRFVLESEAKAAAGPRPRKAAPTSVASVLSQFDLL